jgi:hypothetical protein
MTHYFQDKSCLIVTNHHKELVIAPILEEMLGLKCVYSQIFDTDSLGTFTGEIERIKNPVNTVKDKCMLGIQLPDVDFIVANEGSFGPHPLIPFIKADEEFIAFYDKKENDFVVEKMLFYETNFSTETITEIDQLDTALTKLNFPTHGIIIKAEREIIKDIKDLALIRNKIKELLNIYGQCIIDTDMRAMNNPTRMRCISQLTLKLANTLLSICNQCGRYGFSIIRQVAGLKCSLCNRPTKSILYQLYQCKKCGFEKKKIYPNKKHIEDPTYCDWCNP